MYGWVIGWMDGWIDGWMEWFGWLDDWLDECDNPLSRSVRHNFSPFPNHRSKYISVNRSSIRYGFHVGVKAIRYCVNIALTLVVQTYTADRYFK